MKTLCIIPAYNEEENLGEIIERIKEQGDCVDKIVVIDDDSEDGTVEVAKGKDVDVVSHLVNRGPGCALQTAFDLAIIEDFDCVVQIDADGQHDPEYIPELIQRIEDGYDMVIGSRYLNKSYEDYSLIRRSGIKFFSKLINSISGEEITDITSGYRAWNVEMLGGLGKIRERHWAVEHTLEVAKKGYRIGEISVEMPQREEGESQFDPKTFIKYPFKMLKNIIKVLLYR